MKVPVPSLLIVLLPVLVQAASIDSPYQICPGIVDDTARLRCFDSFSPSPPSDESLTERDYSALERLILSQSNDQPLFGSGVDGLSTHEPNKLLARVDANDTSRPYLDATLSVKYPILRPVVNALADTLRIDRERNLPRLYMAFSTRFSQYLGSRDSAPVIQRRYTPELFLRVWRDGAYDRGDPSFWDFGYGHESNGQQISTEAAFLRAREALTLSGEAERFARDYISRGWDYVSVDWHKLWNTGFLPDLPGRTETHVEYRHYLSNGLFQGVPEEFNVWEGDGADSKSRDYYDGLRFSLQYSLLGEDCLEFVCFERVELVHETGYAKPFAHNTTVLDITTDFGGLPLHIWAQSGYNSDLVDYYDYTNSWGIGIEFNR